MVKKRKKAPAKRKVRRRAGKSRGIPGPGELALDGIAWLLRTVKAGIAAPWNALKTDNHARLFGLVFLFALISRLWIPDWYNDRQFHPDERWLFDKTSQLSYIEKSNDFPYLKFGMPGEASNDPAGLQYGSLPLYIVATAKDASMALRQATGNRMGVYDVIKGLGRRITGLVDALGVLFMFLLGTALWNRKTGLLAATFLAFTPLNIQLAHFFTVDPYMSSFALLTLLGCAKLLKEPTWKFSALTGVALAATLASKSAALPLVLVVAVAHLLAYWSNRPADPKARAELFKQLGIGLGIAAGATLVAFFFFMPHALLNFGKFLRNQTEQRNILVTGSPMGTPYVRQYWDTLPFFFHLKNILFYYQGIPLALLGFAAFVWQLVKPALGMAGVFSRSGPATVPAPKAAKRSRRVAATKKVDGAQGMPPWLDPGMLLLLIWVGLYFAIVGWSFAKFARYMLPVTAALSLISAATLMSLWPAAGLKRKLMGLLTGLVLVISFGYAGGYVTTFTRPHPWIAASEWIFNNVPRMVEEDGKKRPTQILNESWGDDLPVQVSMGNAGSYRNQKINIVEWDGRYKLRHLGDRLQWADLVVMADARAYGTYLRLPSRFPLTHAYFHLMMSDPGRLGFERAAEFSNKVQVFGVEIDDTRALTKDARWWADESWTLYDRPHVFLFRKVEGKGLSSEQVQQVLKDYIDEQGLSQDWQQQERASPEFLRNRGSAEEGPARTEEAMAPAKVNPNLGLSRGEMKPTPLIPGPLAWWLLLVALGMLATPLTARVFSAFPDGGAALAKPVGLLLFGWLAFNLVSYSSMPFYQRSLWMTFAILAVTALLLLWRKKAAATSWVKGRGSLLLWGEGVFLVAFAYFTILRALNPHIHDIMTPGYFGGGEPLGMTYLNAVTRCAEFPVYDPWLSQASSSYYYFGYVMIAALTKMTGLEPAVTYNLSLATFFALAVVAAWGLGLALTGRKRFAAVAAAAVVCFGSLWTLPHVAKQLNQLWMSLNKGNVLGQTLSFVFYAPFDAVGSLFTHSYIWDPTRFPDIVSGAIYEFPFFSYLYSDLHPHNMVVPFTLVLLGLLLVPFMSARTGWKAFGESPALLTLWFLLLALFLDVQFAINAWSYPVLASLGLLCLLFAGWVGRPGTVTQRLIASATGLGLGIAAGLVGWFVLMHAFHGHFEPGQTDIGWIRPGERKMPLYQPLAYFFFGLVPLAYLAGSRIRDWWNRMDKTLRWRSLLEYEWADVIAELPGDFAKKAPLKFAWFCAFVGIALLLGLFSVLGVANGQAMFFGLLGVWVAAAMFALQTNMDGRESFVWLLGLLTMGVVGGAEVLFVADRMNTIFKFWFNGFMFMGLVFAYGFWRVWVETQKAPAAAPAKRLSKREQERQRIKAWLSRLALPLGALAMILLWLIAAWIDVVQNKPYRFSVSSWIMGLTLLATVASAWFSAKLARGWLRSVFTALLVLGLTYPIGASIARIADTSQLHHKIRAHGFWGALKNSPDLANPTLDGLAFMRDQKGRSGFDYNQHDADLIDWLNQNADKTEVILEAPGTEMYRGFSRFAIYTGLPTVLGWQYQVGQQIGSRRASVLNERAADARTLYQTFDEDKARALLDKYQIRWIVVGGIEKRAFAGPGLEKFARIAKVVRKNEGAVLYRYEGGS